MFYNFARQLATRHCFSVVLINIQDYDTNVFYPFNYG